MNLIPIKEQNGFLYLFIGTNPDDPNDPTVHSTYAKDQVEAEEIFLEALGGVEGEDLDSMGESHVYKIKL